MWQQLTLTTYEAQTPLAGGVSRCPTRVGIRQLYDTRTTPVRIVKQVSPKKNLFAFDTLKKLNIY
jgi:hypothetical protein